MIRDAVVDDADGLGAVHVAAWRSAYRGLMPAAYLDGLSVEGRAAHWRQLLAGVPPDRSARLVAHAADTVVGFIVVGPMRDDGPDETGEVYSLNVAPSEWGSGHGGRLLRAGTRRLISAGFRAAVLWVHPDNPRARSFYERYGWCPTDVEREQEVHGVVVPEVRYELPLVGRR